jgi:hypothetical protein
MRAYLDAGLLFTTLLETDGSAAANHILQAAEAPFELTLLHQLQAEHLITRLLTSKEAPRQSAGGKASRLWQRYTAEGVFQIIEPDWQDAIRLSIAWTRRETEEPPSPLLVLHPCLALVNGATHFASFDPRSRLLAKRAGLKLLPLKLED